MPAGELVGLGRDLALHALIEARNVNDDALVRAISDRFLVIAGLDPERQGAVVDRDQLSGCSHPHPDRCCREMSYVEVDPKTLMSGRQEALDGRECCRLNHIDHDRGRQHRYKPAANAGRRVFNADQKVGRSCEPRSQA